MSRHFSDSIAKSCEATSLHRAANSVTWVKPRWLKATHVGLLVVLIAAELTAFALGSVLLAVTAPIVVGIAALIALLSCKEFNAYADERGEYRAAAERAEFSADVSYRLHLNEQGDSWSDRY